MGNRTRNKPFLDQNNQRYRTGDEGGTNQLSFDYLEQEDTRDMLMSSSFASWDINTPNNIN